MRATVPDRLEKGRLIHGDPALRAASVGPTGMFFVRGPRGAWLLLLANDGDPDLWRACGYDPPAFEHVSVSVRHPGGACADRCPTWEEMAWVKDLFWGPEECVVQYHPPRSRHVNCHPYVLHLWRPAGVEIPQPPPETVGPLVPTEARP